LHHPSGRRPPRLAGVSEDVTVTDEPDKHRFELRSAGELAGYLTYRTRPDGAVSFTHTEVFPEFSGRGFGGVLAASALAEARRRGWKIVPQCPFVRAFVTRHPDEYADLLTS
jgi:uncharacterized protein